MASPSGDFIDANGRKLRFLSVNDPPRDRMPHASVNAVPTRAEEARCLAPRQPPRPSAQEPFVGRCHALLAAAPFQVLGLHAALRTRYPPHGIHEYHGQPEDGNELKLSGFPRVVGRASRSAPTATRLAVLSRANVDDDPAPG